MSIFKFRTGSLPLGQKTYLMGIVNITPDSFSDGGKYYDPAAASEHALALVRDGADIIDLGACSTRPYAADPVSPREEQDRLLPVLKELRRKVSVPLSIDTFNADTALKALEAGADIINDVSGIFRPDIAEAVREYRAGYIVMHGGVKIAPSQTEHLYPDGLLYEIHSFFDDVTQQLASVGIEKDYICLDPGFGFGKNTLQNAELLRDLERLSVKEYALLAGLSRKRFIGALSGDADASDRLAGTIAANVMCAERGADIIRTHEIRLHKQALAMSDAICLKKLTK